MYHIVICEYSTGIVLEIDGKTRFNNLERNGNYPSISFLDLDSAEEEALNIIKNKKHLEVSIYKDTKEFVKRLNFSEMC
jgi:hypothetical protein